MSKLSVKMAKWPVLLLAGVVSFLVSLKSFGDGVTGIGSDTGDAEYLFGFSGSVNNTLTLNGGASILSTGTSEFNPGIRNQGWWSATAANNTGNDNYIVGTVGSDVRNNFFTFSIAGLSPNISSAVLDVQRFSGNSDLGHTTQTYSIYDVSTSAATLNANNGTSASIFNDLGSGTLYGSYSISVVGSSSEILHLTLDAAAISDLNAAIQAGQSYFSVGGTLTPSDSSVPDTGFTFTLLMLGSGFVGLVGRRLNSTSR